MKSWNGERLRVAALVQPREMPTVRPTEVAAESVVPSSACLLTCRLKQSCKKRRRPAFDIRGRPFLSREVLYCEKSSWQEMATERGREAHLVKGRRDAQSMGVSLGSGPSLPPPLLQEL